MKTLEDEMIEAMIQNANNFGSAVDAFHPDYGQIIKDGKATEVGIKFFKEQKEKVIKLGKIK